MQYMEEEKLNELSGQIIGCAIKVAKKLRPGYLEKVYENALLHELNKGGFQVDQQVPLAVHYDGVLVGEFIADFIVNNTIILELKAVSAISNAHIGQAINYLTTTDSQLCLILNFGEPKLGIKRIRN